MNLIELIIPALLVIFIVFQARAIIPRVVSFLFPARRQLFFDDTLQNQSNLAHWDVVQPVAEKIESLGFNRLGILSEKPVLWGKGFREISLASKAVLSFASVGFRGYKPSYFFYTAFTDGQIVITSYNAFRKLNKPDLITTVVNKDDPAEMLDMHKKQVENQVSEGWIPFREYNREDAIKATQMYYNASYPKMQLRTAAISNLLFLAFLIFVLVLYLVVLFK
jgi:hypothetical protein